MAEAAVEILILSIDLLLKSPEIDFGGLRHQVSKIKLELDSMKSFLREAEKYKDGDEGICCWVAQVRDAAMEAEGVLDEFLYHLYSIRRRGFRGFLHRFVLFPKETWKRFQTAARLKEIRHEIKGIAERSKRYDLSRIGEDTSSGHSLNYALNTGETSFFVEGLEVVGIEEENELLLKWLMGEEKHRSVLSIVGMGGSGKTTIAAHAYNNTGVKDSFKCFAWVSVSLKYTIEDILSKMIHEFSSGSPDFPSGTSNYKQLVEFLVRFLQDKRYVIVLDDVWSDRLWKQVKVALPDRKNGSRVVITTRKEDIATYPYGAGSHVLRCKPLSKDESWTLFCNKAFCNESSGSCPPELEDIARALVGTCEGLPLAILALGGLMASKDRTELKWKEVYNSLSWHISNNSMLDDVKTILLLSFNDLPYYLKNCFLYFCLFPKEHPVGAGRLIRMWMAEGFLEERKELPPEDVGKLYLRELMSRNLILVEKHETFLRPKLCKLHELMRELACFLSERDRFVTICNPQDLEEETKARRLTYHAMDSTLQLGQDMNYIRSFSAFNVKEQEILPLDNLFLKFRLLRVLELIDAPIACLPRALGKLFNLRYLGLKRTRITELPTSVGRLRNLLTLDIRRTRVEELPKEIGKLRKLRHLLIYAGSDEEGFCYVRGIRVPTSIVKLKNLQVVNCVEANSDIVRGLKALTQVRRLELTNLKKDDESDLCVSIEKMKSLHHLFLMARDENEYLQVERLSSTPPVLRKLTMAGRLNDIPGWFASLRNVIHIHLHWSRLTNDPIPTISRLPVLVRLTLVNAFSDDTERLCFGEGFSRLEELHVGYSSELVEIEICEGVMPKLVRMNIHDCPQLRRVPLGIEHLRSMQKLNLKHVSEELTGRVNGGVDYLRVKHIPEKSYDRVLSGLHGAQKFGN